MSCVYPKIPNSMYFMVLGKKLKDLGIDAAPFSSSFNLDSGRKWHPETEELTLKGSKMRIRPSVPDQGDWKAQDQNLQQPPFWEGKRESGGTENEPKSWTRRAGRVCHTQRQGMLMTERPEEWKVRKHYRIQQLGHHFFKRSTSAKCKN